MSMVIGGADGPTAIFLAGKVGNDWFNPFGLFFILMMLLPNILYAVRFRQNRKGAKEDLPAPIGEQKCENRLMVWLEQIGRYLSMFLMVFNIGILEYGFFSFDAITIYLMVNLMLLTAYAVIWIAYFWRQTFQKSMLLAVIPAAMFLLSGIIMRHIPLIASAVVFGVGHIYVTYQRTAPIKKE